jgi:spore coat polysaccharide biosynthesis protein SpsF
MLGKPMIAYLLEGLEQCRTLDGIVLATSSEASDDPIAEFAEATGVVCDRGPLADVAARILGAARHQQADAVVRVSGDSPLLDPALVDHAVDLFRRERPDVVTNVRPRSYPKGQSVEVISCAALSRALGGMSTPDEHEHVTIHFYAHPERYTIRSFTAAHPRPELQLSVDDADDFERCEAVLAALGRPPWEAGWEACVTAYDGVTAKAVS